MQNTIPKFKKSSVISEKPGYLSQKLKTLTTMHFHIFCWNFERGYYLPMSTKACSGFFSFCLDLELLIICKEPGLCECIETMSFVIFGSNWRSKQNKENYKHFFVYIGKWVTYVKFQLKIFNSVVVGAHQHFQFFQTNAWFLENNRALSKFLYDILNYLISIVKL